MDSDQLRAQLPHVPPRAAQALRWVLAERETRAILDVLARDDAWTDEQIRAVATDAVHGCNVIRYAQLEGGRSSAKRDAEMEHRLVALEQAVERLGRAARRDFANEVTP